MSNITDSYGRDLLFKTDFKSTASGDYVQVSGIDNVKQRLNNRLITSKGTLVHRPEFGVGLSSYKGSNPTLSTQQKIALDIKSQFLEDEDVEDVTSVSIKFQDNIFYITVQVVIKAYGSTEINFEV